MGFIDKMKDAGAELIVLFIIEVVVAITFVGMIEFLQDKYGYWQGIGLFAFSAIGIAVLYAIIARFYYRRKQNTPK
jgi:hypothetical protein